MIDIPRLAGTEDIPKELILVMQYSFVSFLKSISVVLQIFLFFNAVESILITNSHLIVAPNIAFGSMSVCSR